MPNALVIRLSSLGDIVLTQPVLQALAQSGYSVDLWVKPAYGLLGPLLPGVKRTLTSTGELAPAYDLLLDLHNTVRSWRQSAGIRARRTARYRKHSLARRLLVRPWGRHVFWNSWSRLDPNISVMDGYREAARRAGVIAAPLNPRLQLPPEAEDRAVRVLADLGIRDSQAWAALAPGAKWPTKQWPWENFSQLASRLDQSADVQPVFLGGPSEVALCEIAAREAGGRAVSLAGQTDLPALAGLLSRASLLIANDSGPMHLGLAAGVPVLAFFGPTVPEFGFAPVAGLPARILAKPLPCRPCSLHGSKACPLGHHDCMKKIETDEAWKMSKELLGLDDSASQGRQD